MFRPELVENPNDAAAAARGTLLFQRKGPKEPWSDIDTIALSQFKKGEGYKLELHAAELLTFFRELASLYKLHAKVGIPFGSTELIRADSVVANLMDVPREHLREYLTANQAIGEGLLSRLLAWAADIPDAAAVVGRLVALGDAALNTLNVAVGLGALKRALSVWDENSKNGDEEFWQVKLTEHSFVLEQVFSWPTTIVKGKAYVGGKSVLNTGGNVVDFLVKNQLTNNAALVEIKTPTTPLVGGRYRNVYNASEHLNGAVMQVLNYRYSLQREFHSLRHGIALEAFEPRCVVIVGNTSELRGDEEKTRTVELFRRHSSGVTVITFDELFAKTRRLIDVLEAAQTAV